MQRFTDLINNFEKLRTALEGSHVTGQAAGYNYWYEHRYPIVQAINRSGSILDIGSANGFLLRSLVEWSSHKLLPYGIEPDEALLEKSRIMFPKFADHFANVSLHKLDQARRLGLPNQFDFVYWCVWDDFNFSDKKFSGWLESAYDAVKKGGRLILGFYDGNLSIIDRKIDWLDRNFQPVQNRLDSETQEEIFVWFDKKLDT